MCSKSKIFTRIIIITISSCSHSILIHYSIITDLIFPSHLCIQCCSIKINHFVCSMRNIDSN